jgi:hypothetical protein
MRKINTTEVLPNGDIVWHAYSGDYIFKSLKDLLL